MLKLEDMELGNGCVRECQFDCENCILHLASRVASVKSNLYKWQCGSNGTYCADVLQAWQMGKLAFINGEWYEVEQ